MYYRSSTLPPREPSPVAPSKSWPVQLFSWAGVLLILSGMLGLALPTAQEGACVLVLDSEHAFHAMDVASLLLLGLGVTLTWLGGQLWRRQL